MPKLRRLRGGEVIKIFEGFGFKVLRIRGSHHIMRRSLQSDDGETHQTLNIPVHGKKELGIGLLKKLYRDASQYIDESDLETHFYSE